MPVSSAQQTVAARPARMLTGPALTLGCAARVYAAVDRRMPEGAALAEWLGHYAATFGLHDADLPDEALPRGPRRRGGVSVSDWRRIGLAIAKATAMLPAGSAGAADRWIAAIASRLAFDPTEALILSLALHYRLDHRIERLFDALSACRGGLTHFHRDPALLGLLLHEDPAGLERRLAPEARLLASGLLHAESNGGLGVLSRLVGLIRAGAAPKADFYDQILGATTFAPLPWTSFAHLGREADLAAAMLRAALAAGQGGINLLLYGPPGTGKTSFAASLAVKIGAQLRPVAEADEEGGEPTRQERLSGLRLAHRLAVPGETVLLFDEAEDLFTSQSTLFGAVTHSSRVFIHRLLEQGSVPVIWTANDIGALGPAVLRRMTMCMALKVPNLQARTRLCRPEAPRAVSFLLSGPPGSGKSAWVRHLAARMGLTVLQKRASDLLDPFVGGTERTIASAFAEARESGAFLVFESLTRPTACCWSAPTRCGAGRSARSTKC